MCNKDERRGRGRSGEKENALENEYFVFGCIEDDLTVFLSLISAFGVIFLSRILSSVITYSGIYVRQVAIRKPFRMHFCTFLSTSSLNHPVHVYLSKPEYN